MCYSATFKASAKSLLVHSPPSALPVRQQSRDSTRRSKDNCHVTRDLYGYDGRALFPTRHRYPSNPGNDRERQVSINQHSFPLMRFFIRDLIIARNEIEVNFFGALAGKIKRKELVCLRGQVLRIKEVRQCSGEAFAKSGQRLRGRARPAFRSLWQDEAPSPRKPNGLACDARCGNPCSIFPSLSE